MTIYYIWKLGSSALIARRAQPREESRAPEPSGPDLDALVEMPCKALRKLKPLRQLNAFTLDRNCLDIAHYQGPLSELSLLEMLVHLQDNKHVSTLQVYKEMKVVKERRPDVTIPRLDLLASAMKEDSRCKTIGVILAAFGVMHYKDGYF